MINDELIKLDLLKKEIDELEYFIYKAESVYKGKLIKKRF